MMLPVMSGDCTFQMTLKGLSPDTSELALQLFATVSHETESDDPEWGALDYGTACSGTLTNVSDGNSYDISLQCGGTSVCLPWIYEAAQYEDNMHAVVLYSITLQTIHNQHFEQTGKLLQKRCRILTKHSLTHYG